MVVRHLEIDMRSPSWSLTICIGMIYSMRFDGRNVQCAKSGCSLLNAEPKAIELPSLQGNNKGCKQIKHTLEMLKVQISFFSCELREFFKSSITCSITKQVPDLKQ